MRKIIIAATAFFALAGPAQAWQIVQPNGAPSPYQPWADRIAMPTPNLRVTLVTQDDGYCEGRAGCANPADPTVVFLPNPNRQVLVHELGHIFDYTRMNDAARAQFQRIMRDPRPWRSAPNSPHERFAEAYRLCARKKKPEPLWDAKFRPFYEGNYGYRVNKRQYAAVCKLIKKQSVNA